MRIGGEEFLTYAEATERFGVHRRRLQDAASAGWIATARPGRKKLLRAGDIEAWLKSLVTSVAVPVRRGRPRKSARP